MPQSKRYPPNPNPPIPAHKFAGPYTSPLLLSLPGSTDLQSRYAHLNCSFVSPRLRHGHKSPAKSEQDEELGREHACPVAPTLVDLKRHVQSLCNLIVDLTAWEGPIDACYNPQHNDRNAFDWLDSLRSNTPYATYPPDSQGRGGGGDISPLEPWQSTPLTSVLNRYWEAPELSAEEEKRKGKDKDQFPHVPMPCPLSREYKRPDDIGTIVAHANEIFHELEERLVDKGGILALYPVSSEVGVAEEEEVDENEMENDVRTGGTGGGPRSPNLKYKCPTTSWSAMEASRNTIFGQYLSYTSALAHRVTTLEAELEAAQQALAGEACVPHVLANGVIPTPSATTVDAIGNNKTNSSRTQGGTIGNATEEKTYSRPVFRPLLASQDRYVLANLSPELDARISARLSHDSRARRAAEREAHEKIRPGRTRRDYVPTFPAPKTRPDKQYRSNDKKNDGIGPSQASPPPPPPAPPATPITATTPMPSKSSAKRRRGVEDEDEDEEDDDDDKEIPETQQHPSSEYESENNLSSSSSLATTFHAMDMEMEMDMDVEDTLIPSSYHKPLTPLSYIDIPARAYRVHDASKTIFIVLGVGMGPEVSISRAGDGEGDATGGNRAQVGREELVGGYKKWRKEERKKRKDKGKVVGVDGVTTPPAAAGAAAAGTSIPGPGGSRPKPR